MQSTMFQPYLPLVVWGFVFVVSHFVLSSSIIRDKLVDLIGEKPFLGVYSLLSFVFIFFFVAAYNSIDAPMSLGWMNQVGLHWLSIVLMPFILILAVAGVTSPNPTMTGSKFSDSPYPVVGIFRITRHPLMWAILLWAITHIIAAGDLASLIFFAFLALLAGFGTVALDRKKARVHSLNWQQYVAASSNIPFAAIIARRQRLELREIGWVPLVVGLVLMVVLYVGHIMIPIGTIMVNPLG